MHTEVHSNALFNAQLSILPVHHQVKSGEKKAQVLFIFLFNCVLLFPLRSLLLLANFSTDSVGDSLPVWRQEKTKKRMETPLAEREAAALRRVHCSSTVLVHCALCTVQCKCYCSNTKPAELSVGREKVLPTSIIIAAFLRSPRA